MLSTLLHPLRVALGRFVIPQQVNYTGPHGCLKTGASFISWNQIEGDYLEFGVWKGDSMVEAYRAIHGERSQVEKYGSSDPGFQHWLKNPPRFFAFDSFEGLPQGAGERMVDYQPGSYSASESLFRGNISSKGVDLNRVISVPGFYDKSLTADVKKKHNLKRAAMVMIDCDLYESTAPVMEFLTDIVGQGTILIFHDWYRFKGSPEQGEQRACREWLARNPHIELIEYWKEGPQSVAFLVNIRG